MDLEKMTTKQLKDEALSMEQSMEYGGYGTRDIRMLDSILNELENRGIEISMKLHFN